MLLVNSEGEIRYANRQAGAMFDYAPGELVGKPVEVLMPSNFRASHPEMLSKFFANPRARPMGLGQELLACRKGGETFPIEIGLTPIESEDGKFVLASTVDISYRKNVENELRNA